MVRLHFAKRNENFAPLVTLHRVDIHCINLTLWLVNHAQYSIVLFGAYRRNARHQNDSFVSMSGNTTPQMDGRRCTHTCESYASRTPHTNTGTSFTNGREADGVRYTHTGTLRLHMLTSFHTHTHTQ